MKSSLKLSKLLLLTTIFFAPSIAMAQDAGQPPAAEFEDDEIVVLGRNIPEPMRATSEVAAFLSAEDLARQGDDNAALALTRLTGLTVDPAGRYVFVRGLGDRYSSALLNGSPLPSPEPLRRQVPLNLFPSNILDGATVQKTFSPNYPGEFGGGIIDLRTLRMPREAFFTIKVGTGYNTASTGDEGLTYYGEASDWTGMSDGARAIPSPLANAIGQNQRINDVNFSDAQLEAIGESLVNSPLTVIQSEDLDPDFEGEVTAGSSFDLGSFNVGLVGVFGYDSSIRTQRAERVTQAAGSVGEEIESFSTTWDIVANAFGSASLGWDTHEIALTGLLVRSTSKDAQIDEGTNINDANPRHREATGWYERQLSSVQLAGEHGFGDLQLDWRTAFAQSTRDAPYEREIYYIIPPSGIVEYNSQLSNRTRFSYLTDEVASAGLDASYTLPLSAQREAIFSGGFAYSNAVRWYEQYTFSFTGPAVPAPTDVLQARPDYLFSPDNIDPSRFELHEFTGRDDAYKARMTLSAAYAAADVEILPLLRAAVGVRFEDGTQIVRTGNRFGETPANPVTIEEQYWLPAATLTWNFAEDLQLRLGYSQTIARPQFRELALTPYLDPDTDRIFQGNPALTNSEFTNYDARLEYYFGREQFVTAGLFYKTVTDPVEEVIILGGDGTSTFTRFINAPEATLYGAEIEYRTRFEMPFAAPFLNDPQWMFAVNYTYTFSEVTAGPGDTVINPVDGLPAPASVFGLDGSPLQGTPENIANLQFGYDTEFSQLTLLVGWVDERIARRGLGSLPEVIEDPGVSVDLVYRRDFNVGGTMLTLGLSGRNLLDEDHVEYQESAAVGRTDINTYERGQSFSVSLTAKY
jgi:outer membrane receptor protein involved in Fe transport